MGSFVLEATSLSDLYVSCLILNISTKLMFTYLLIGFVYIMTKGEIVGIIASVYVAKFLLGLLKDV